jgi:hypothetical protein
LNAYQLNPVAKEQILISIQNMLYNNSFPWLLIHNIQRKRIHRWKSNNSVSQESKWVTFTVCGNEKKYFTKRFEYTNLRIACRTKNTIRYHVGPKNISREQINSVVVECTN